RPAGELDGRHLEVSGGPFRTALTAHARLLEATERLVRINDHAVDRNVARTDATGNRVSTLGSRRIDRCIQALLGIIGLANRIILILEGDDGNDRAEDFLLGDIHVGLDVDENSRLNIEALVQACRATATAGDLRALGAASSDVAFNARALAAHRQRA